jgi:hypothetical protein
MTKTGFRVLMSRRDFMRKTTATCSLVCCGGVSLSSLLRGGQEANPPTEKHKFLRDAGMSYHDIFQMAVVRLYLPTVKAVAADIGMDNLQRILMEDRKKRIADQVKDLPIRDLRAFSQFFKNPNPFAANSLTMEIVQDSDKVFEMRFSECLWAKTFKEADAADIGFKLICTGDYVTAEAFNPKIKLIRDKTLMQGHDCCNHKYVVQG